MKEREKIVTVGIPAFKAQDHICDLLSSIQIQTMRKNISVVIANDNPGDREDYVKLAKRFPDLDITVLPDVEKNGGPGVARQRILEACETSWITFCDADDLLISPFSIESLVKAIESGVIEVQGVFYQEVTDHPQGVRMLPRNDVGHPWVFGRLYFVDFLRMNDIKFSKLRAMEDGQFNWEIRMSIEGTPLKINIVDAPIYLWRVGSEHSITRIGVKENGGIPLYNYDLCQVGATAAAINAIHHCKKRNPFNGGITRFTVEIMIGHYFTYIECLDRKPLFAKQNLFNAKRFYNLVYKQIENQIDDKILKDMYTMQLASKSPDLIGIIPEITFFDFMKLIKEQEYNGKDEFLEIRKELPQWVVDLDLKSGVLGEEGYIHTEGES